MKQILSAKRYYVLLDQYFMYKNGIRVNARKSHEEHNSIPNSYNKLAFRLLHVNELDINHCNCQMDDIRIFEVAMDADEIMNLM